MIQAERRHTNGSSVLFAAFGLLFSDRFTGKSLVRGMGDLL